MNAFQYTDYRSFLNDWVKEHKRLDSSYNFSNIGKATSIPKSYISKVLGGDGNFSEDQLYQICQFLKLDEVWTEYLFLSLSYCRSDHFQRKEVLFRRLKRFQETHMSSESYLKETEVVTSKSAIGSLYHLDPLHQLVHVALSIQKYKNNLNRLSVDLKIDKKRIREIINNLIKWGIVELQNEQFEILQESLHLSKQSELYPAWLNLVRSLSQSRFDVNSDYSFSTLFSGSANTQKEIHLDFLDFLEKTKNRVTNSESEEIYQINFDLVGLT